VATVVALGFIAYRSEWSHRLRVLLLAVGVAVVVGPALATFAPGALPAARERLLSLGQYATDNSVRVRIVEARDVFAKIADHPLIGSGLGDTVYWGMPWLQVPPSSHTFAHNDYLLLSWKLGIPAALILIALVSWAIAARPPPALDPLTAAVRVGAQASLLAMLVISVTFPSLSALASTTTLGVLVAICLLPREVGTRSGIL
jgi:O-antigen ligase